MEIEIRNSDGAVVADLKGMIAYGALEQIKNLPTTTRKIKKFVGKPEMEVLVVNEHYKFIVENKSGSATIWLIKGSYIKIL